MHQPFSAGRRIVIVSINLSVLQRINVRILHAYMAQGLDLHIAVWSAPLVRGYYNTLTKIKQFLKLHLINAIPQTLHSFNNTDFESRNYADDTFMILFQPSILVFSPCFCPSTCSDIRNPISDSLPVKALLS